MDFFKKYFFIFLSVALLPFIAFASNPSGVALLNPLPVGQELYCPTAYCDLQSMVLLIIKDILTITPIVAVLMIIVGGFRLVISHGNEEQIIQAKKTIIWAVLGLAVALLSFSIVAILQNFLAGNI